MNDPVIRKTVTAFGDREFDPEQAAKASAKGYKDAGILDAFIVGLLRTAIRLLKPLILEAASLIDDVLSALADAFLIAQGEHSAGYYRLASALMTDLLGIEVDGAKLQQDLLGPGRQRAMEDLGGAVYDVLAAEFGGVAQTSANGAFTVAKGAGIAGLPDIQLSPTQGVNGGRALLGYASAFAIREGNTDMLAAILPHGVGEMFKDFAEDFSKNLGIGRMVRLVWKPLVNTMVAQPMQQALNDQYRPTVLGPPEAFRAWLDGWFTDVDLHTELARHGYSEKRISALRDQHVKTPERLLLRDLHALGLMSDPDYSLYNRRLGYTDEMVALLDSALDVAPIRAGVLRAADSLLAGYLAGRVTGKDYHDGIQSLKSTVFEKPLLTAGEILGYEMVEGKGFAGKRHHLSLAMLFRDYEDGLITLTEFTDKVTELGYGPDDVQLLEQELLISAKRASDRAHKAATAATHGLFAKLTVAQMKTAFESGIMTLAQVRTELVARQYTHDAIETLANEFLIAAKLRSGTPPTP
jgi:hypothetical protein